MSLLTDHWLPVRTRSGERRWVAPDQLSDPDLMAFDADRADFNGALFQFAVGLLQTTAPVEGGMDWRALFASPPDADTLQSWFKPVASAFEYEGDGPRFMQDRSLDAAADVSVGALLIDSPGENAIEKNSDHFIKRGRVSKLCPHCVITALLTLQINAPAGGAGHRTGLRGGGPLTTLLCCQPSKTLWHDLWLNVMERPEFLTFGGDQKLGALHFTFPWMADISAIQKEGGETAPRQVHPFHVFWAMPRRIRLDLACASSGACDICSRTSDRLIKQYATKPYGLNYKGAWNHPLSPYYESKEGWFPLHPQPGGFGYRHWLAWLTGVGDDKQRQRPSRIVDHFLRERSRQRQAGTMLKLWAFGYDMDNMKARCWYEASLPMYGLADCDREAIKLLEVRVGDWMAAAKFAAYTLRSSVKAAWFGGDARGDFSAIDAAFWSQTERVFYRQLKTCIDASRDTQLTDLQAINERWLQAIVQTAFTLFDDVFVGAGPIERQNPRRVAAAHKLMRNSLYGTKLRQLLRLPVKEPDSAKKGNATGKRNTKSSEQGASHGIQNQ